MTGIGLERGDLWLREDELGAGTLTIDQVDLPEAGGRGRLTLSFRGSA